MDIAVSLGLEAAAASVLALPEKYLRKEAAYSLNEGRLLLSVTLGEKETEKAGPEDISSYMAGEQRRQAGVRLVPSLGSKMKRAIRNAASGFELHSYGKVACGIFSFALTALILGTSAPAAQELPSCSDIHVKSTIAAPELLASVTQPAPNHAFRRGRLSGWDVHQNVTGEHINHDVIWHVNKGESEPGTDDPGGLSDNPGGGFKDIDPGTITPNPGPGGG